MQCAYCEEELKEEESTTYMYFPNEGYFKKVHWYHLKAERKENKNAKPAP